MKLDEICNGKLEQQIREGLARLDTITPKGGSPRIYVSASSNPNHGYVAADMEGVHGLNAFGCNTIPEAVATLVAKVNSPEAIERRKAELLIKIAVLQSELDAIHAPITVVPESSAALEA